MAKITYKPIALEGREFSCFLMVTTIQEAIDGMAELYSGFAKALEMGGNSCFILSVNDLEVPQDMWSKYPIFEKDEIIISHDIGEFGLAGLWIGSWLISYSTLTALAISLVVNIAIYALNYFTRPDPPRSRPHDFTSASPTYSWSGIVTTHDVDMPIAVPYGKHRIGGNVINHFISTDGDKNYWNVLLALGHGPIGGIWKADGTGLCESNQNIPDVMVNGNPFINYDNIKWDYRLGTLDQTPVEGFDATHTVFPIGNIKVTPSGYIYTTTDIVEAIEFKLSCLLGLWQQDGAGNILENSVTYKVEYRLYGSQQWTLDGEYTIRDKSKTALHRYYRKDGLNGRYDFRITRTSPEETGFNRSSDLYLTAVDEIVFEKLAYPGIALFSVKMLATEYLQGEMPNFQIMINGRTVMVPKLTYLGNPIAYDKTYWDTDEEVYVYANWDSEGKWISDIGECVETSDWIAQTTKEPIWNTTDFISSRRYGNGEHINLDTIDLDRHAIESKYAYGLVKTDGVADEWEHRFEMDGVIDGQSSSIDILSQICSTFQAFPLWAEGSYKILIDRPQTPVQMITKANIVKDSFKWAFYPLSQRPNSFTASFLDRKGDYTRDNRQIVDTLVYTNNLPIRPHNIHIPLVVRESQILRELKYLLNCSKYRTQIIELAGGIDSIHIQGGDTFYFSYDVNHSQIGGRILDIDGLSLTLDRPVTIEQGNNYKITARLPDPTKPGKEMFESRTVTSAPGTYEVITIASAFSVTPIQWETVYVFGLQTEVTKQFRALSASFDENRKIAIKAVETIDAIWDGLGGTLIHVPPPQLPGPLTPPEDVTDLLLEETLNSPGIRISYNKPERDTNWFCVEILLSSDGIHYSVIAHGFEGRLFEYYNVTPGVKYYVKVVSFSKYNVASLNPPIASITIGEFVPDQFRPPNIRGLELFGQGNDIEWKNRDAKFTWRPIALYSGAGVNPADTDPLNAGQGFLDVAWQDYKIEIWVGGVKKREEYTRENHYIYSYEKNAEDNGTPSNTITIKVWNRTIYNVLSINPAVLTVINSAPPLPKGLSTFPLMNGVRLKWSPSTVLDHDYWMIRHRVGGDSWSSWESISELQYSRYLTKTEIETHGLFPTIYFELKDIDTFGNHSDVASDNEECFAIAGLALEDLSITTTKIADDSIETPKLKAGVIIGDKIAANTIGGGHILAGSITGENIEAGTITTDKLVSTIWGDMGQAMNYVKTVLAANDEYSHPLTKSDLNDGVKNNVDIISGFYPTLRIEMTRLWNDGAGAWWDTQDCYWDHPTQSSGSWESESVDLGEDKSIQMGLVAKIDEDFAPATSITVKAIYSIDNINWGMNEPVFDDDEWETLSEGNWAQGYKKYVGSLFTFRYFKVKIELSTTDTSKRIVLSEMSYEGSVVNLVGFEVEYIIASGGTSIPLKGFKSKPSITVTPVGTTPLVDLITAQSKDSVTVKLYNLAGNDVGGIANITIIGT